MSKIINNHRVIVNAAYIVNTNRAAIGFNDDLSVLPNNLPDAVCFVLK